MSIDKYLDSSTARNAQGEDGAVIDWVVVTPFHAVDQGDVGGDLRPEGRGPVRRHRGARARDALYDVRDGGAGAARAGTGCSGDAGVSPRARRPEAYWRARTPARSSFRWTAWMISPAAAAGSVYVGGNRPVAR